MTYETPISLKDLQTKYQLLLAENRLLKEELNALKSGLSGAESQRQREPSLSHEPENTFNPLRQNPPPKASLTVQNPPKKSDYSS